MATATKRRTPETVEPTVGEQLTQTLADALDRWNNEQARIATLKNRLATINHALGDETDETARETLRQERARIVSDLTHAPDDIGALAGRYAGALRAWGEHEIATARAAWGEAETQLGPYMSEYARARNAIAPGTAVRELTPERVGAANATIERLQPLIDPLIAQRDAALARRDNARARLVSRFGDLDPEGQVDVNGVRRFIEGARRQAFEQIGSLTPNTLRAAH